ncbi:Hypothetical protein CINCED_3A017552 [Cinara cedri]|uniref:Uncharacterized protein n=2 Tax=Cinara cedri TaxID=506608 RepID=A0A5E4NQC2_9HEMI|nr:Hypothetical protein CINCED_3A017552 [Cinara cedri]
MNGIKQLILVLSCLLYVFQVESSDEHDDKHEGINQIALGDENEELTPLAGHLIYEWWSSIPLDYMKYRENGKKDHSGEHDKNSKENTSSDHSLQNKIFKDQITEKGLKLLRDWWLEMPIFQVSKTKFTPQMYKDYINKGELPDYMKNNDNSNAIVPVPVIPRSRSSSFRNNYPYRPDYLQEAPYPANEEYPYNPSSSSYYDDQPPPRIISKSVRSYRSRY